LRTTELFELRRDSVQSFLAGTDHIIAVCEWVKNILEANGVPSHKITLCRQGTKNPWVSDIWDSDRPDARSGSPTRIPFLGRLHPTKGVHVLIEALRSLPKEALELAIYGLVQDESASQYERELRRMAADDKRIKFHPPVPAEDVIWTLQQYDLLAV